MELINATRMTAGYTMGMEPSGRELLVVVIKGTFLLPRPHQPVQLHDEQLPLIVADSRVSARRSTRSTSRRGSERPKCC